MEELSEREVQGARAFRAGVHREALEKVQKRRPWIKEVIDRCPVESYFRTIWDYPGAWYRIVAIPEGFASRDELIDTIVRDTLAHEHKP